MKTLTILTVIAVSMVLFVQKTLPQEVNQDSITHGRYYNILLSNDEWIEGEILASDSMSIKLQKADGSVSKFSKAQVKAIIVPSNDEVKEYYSNRYSGSGEVMKPSLSLSGGLGLTTFEESGGFPSSYIFSLEGTIYAGRNQAVRLNVDCNFMGNENNYSSGGPGYSYYEEGGNISAYIITVDMLLGSLKPEEKTRQYFTCGLGTLILSESERKSVNISEFGSYSNTYQGETYILAGLKIGYGINHSFSSKITAGGELLYATPFSYLMVGMLSVKPRINYKISNNFSLLFEPQFSLPVTFEEHSFISSGGYFTVKSGITIGSF